MNASEIELLATGDGPQVAYRQRLGAAPTILFLPGYMSDMEGAKAQAVDAFAAERGVGCVRFDYSGTGSSEGSFEDGRLDGWLEECLLIADTLTEGPLVVAGSSMGGWLALHLALRRPERVQAILGIAAAPDFTDWGFGGEERGRLLRDRRIEERHPDGSVGRLFTEGFWRSGQGMLLLDSPIALDCPVRLVHGEDDRDVPLDVALRTMRQLRSADVQLSVIKGGGHRLSAPHEIAAILRALAELVEPSR